MKQSTVNVWCYLNSIDENVTCICMSAKQGNECCVIMWLHWEMSDVCVNVVSNESAIMMK